MPRHPRLTPATTRPEPTGAQPAPDDESTPGAVLSRRTRIGALAGALLLVVVSCCGGLGLLVREPADDRPDRPDLVVLRFLFAAFPTLDTRKPPPPAPSPTADYDSTVCPDRTQAIARIVAAQRTAQHDVWDGEAFVNLQWRDLDVATSPHGAAAGVLTGWWIATGDGDLIEGYHTRWTITLHHLHRWCIHTATTTPLPTPTPPGAPGGTPNPPAPGLPSTEATAETQIPGPQHAPDPNPGGTGCPTHLQPGRACGTAERGEEFYKGSK